MIVEILENDHKNINKLENKFSTFFSYNGYILDDFRRNIFSKYFIYLIKSNIIGYVNYYEIYDRIEIANIFVDNEYRNKKIGSKMIEYLLKIADNKNIKNITLEVREDNYPAIALYKKYKFEKVAIRENYYNGVDGILMERKMK